MTAEGEEGMSWPRRGKGASWRPGESKRKGVRGGGRTDIWPLIITAGKLPELCWQVSKV